MHPVNTSVGKKVVHYIDVPTIVGNVAYLTPIDHPDFENVSNTKLVRTSRIVSHNEGTGRIETQNTIYVPA